LEAVVLASGKEEDKFLIAYFVAREPINTSDLMNFLSGRLPAHMIPSYFMEVAKLPLTSNGKLDRKALPTPVTTIAENRCYPSNERQEKLARIWSDILKIDESVIDIRKSFFDLGGHSIRSVHLIHRIQEEFGVQFELKALYKNATIETLSELLEQNRPASVPVFARVDKMDFYPASSAQERLYYEQWRNPESLTSNIPAVYEIMGNPDISKLEECFRDLIAIHEGLRTTFRLADGQVVQIVSDEVRFAIEQLDELLYDNLVHVLTDFVRPFDLFFGPLIRVGILKKRNGSAFLIVDLHHIVSDGYSLNILMNDFKRIYNGTKPEPPAVRYIDYAAWQRDTKGNLANEESYWRNVLSGELPVVDLPTVRDRTTVEISDAGSNVLVIGGTDYQDLKKLAESSKVSEYMILLSALFIFLSKVTGKTDLLIGTDTLGRVQAALKKVVGTFVNVVPLRQHLDYSIPYDQFLDKVRNTVLEAFEHQEYPFDQMSSLLADDARQRIIDVYLSFADVFESESDTDEVSFAPISVDRKRSTRYELELNVENKANELMITFVYSSALYDSETIDLFTQYYYNVLRSVLHDASTILEDIQIVLTKCILSKIEN